MGAEVDQGVDPLDLPQAEIEGEIAMGRRRIGVVITRFAIGRGVARRLQRDGELAETHESEAEGSAAAGGVGFGGAMAGEKRGAGGGRNRGEPVAIGRERNGEVGGTLGECGHQPPTLILRSGCRPLLRMRVEGRDDVAGDIIPRPGQQFPDRQRARWRVEADGEAGAAAAGGIVRHHQSEPPLGGPLAAERHPIRRELGERGDAVRIGREPAQAEAGRGIADLLLEGDRDRAEPAVELRQRRLHGEVGGGKPAWRGFPGLAGAADRHGLQDRTIGSVEHEALALAGREGGAGDDQRRLACRDQRGEPGRDGGVLEAGQGERKRGKAARGKGCRDRLDHRGVTGGDAGAIDEDGHERRFGRQGGERGAPGQGRGVGAEGEERRERGGSNIGCVALRFQITLDTPQQPPHVLGTAAGVEIAQQRARERRRHRAMASQPLILPVVAGQHGESHAVLPAGGGDLLDAVAPAVEPTQAAQQHET